MIPLFKIHSNPNIGNAVQKVFDSGFIAQGSVVDEFEEKLGSYLGTKDISCTNSATSALTLAYRLANIAEGDEVITSPMTCMATNEPLDLMGAKLVWADIDPATGNIDPEDVSKKITSKTKAIVGVHWAGQPFEIREINNLARNNNIKVIEDAAHAFGAKYNDEYIGNHSDYVIFSFQAIKHLTTGDGGALVCKSAEDTYRARKLRWFGLDREFQGSKWTQDISESGYKFNMNNINAAIGIENLQNIDFILEKHKDNCSFYDKNINNSNIVKLSRNPHSQTSCWIYTLLTPHRDRLQHYLAEKGIASDVVHVRNDTYSVFKRFSVEDTELKGVQHFCSQHLNIPVGWWVSEQDREYIVDVINKFQ
jgi:dTDP-4-amino-4,6-dideoxygalactose transaminase